MWMLSNVFVKSFVWAHFICGDCFERGFELYNILYMVLAVAAAAGSFKD